MKTQTLFIRFRSDNLDMLTQQELETVYTMRLIFARLNMNCVVFVEDCIFEGEENSTIIEPIVRVEMQNEEEETVLMLANEIKKAFPIESIRYDCKTVTTTIRQ